MPYKDPEKKRLWEKAHPEKRKQSQNNYHHRHKEECNQRWRDWYQTHKEQRRIYKKQYALANVEKIRTQHRAWVKANPEIVQAGWYRHRTHKSLGLCTATPAQIKAIKAAYKGRCAYCGIKPKQLTIDHVTPLARNGGHTPDNLVPACRPCNAAKGTRQPTFIPAIRLLL